MKKHFKKTSHAKASLGDAMFAAGQYEMWSRYVAAHGRSGEANRLKEKARQKAKGLQTMMDNSATGVYRRKTKKHL